jgi:hypothetical protein
MAVASHWHLVEQAWEDPDVPIRWTDAARRAEHERLMAEETAESVAAGSGPVAGAAAELSSHQDVPADATVRAGHALVCVPSRGL